MRIAIGVPGRFHAFELARGLVECGHEVAVLTTYPRWAARPFCPPQVQLETCGLLGAASKLAWGIGRSRDSQLRDVLHHRLSGMWLAGAVRAVKPDVVYVFSGVAEEILKSRPARVMTMARGSAHIRAQRRLLEEEEARTGERILKPSRWLVEREEREYALADQIIVLSTFARNSFVEEGIPPEKLILRPLAVRVERFRGAPGAMAERQHRILSREPLRVLFAGTVSLRKGIWDLVQAAKLLRPGRVEFRLVGQVEPDAMKALAEAGSVVRVSGRVPEERLRLEYARTDVFILPSIEDGFAVTILQALAAGLPVLATRNTGAPDVITEGVNGWIVPIRDPRAIVERLRWCDENRDKLAMMVAQCAESAHELTWTETARELSARWEARM